MPTQICERSRHGIMARAKVKPWPKLFQNLRSPLQTELEEILPSHIVCAWIGNSEKVAQEHYLQMTDEHLARGRKFARSRASRNIREHSSLEENRELTELTTAECSGREVEWAIQDSNL
jgi:hypothetical protein